MQRLFLYSRSCSCLRPPSQAAGGLTIGVLPGDSPEEMSEYIDLPILTGMGSARDNVNALSGAVMVAVGIGPGELRLASAGAA